MSNLSKARESDVPKINHHERQVLLKAIHFSEVGHKTPTKDTSGFCVARALQR